MCGIVCEVAAVTKPYADLLVVGGALAMVASTGWAGYLLATGGWRRIGLGVGTLGLAGVKLGGVALVVGRLAQMYPGQ